MSGPAPRAKGGVFRSLRNRNYRIWAGGALVSNVGTWMQRIAQDWLILTQLTHHDARAVGVVIGLQFAPQVLLLPWTGYAADHLDRRKLLAATQAAMGLLAAGLGLLTLSGMARAWHVYVFAFLLGCAAAFDAPVRQSFVSDLVGEDLLPNAVALNSTSFNASRLVGPAIAGVLMAALGTGWVFLINAGSYAAVLMSLTLIRGAELYSAGRAKAPRGKLADGFRYVWARPDLRAVLLMLFVVGTFGLSFPIYISTMAVSVFHVGASGFGLLTSAMAVGSVTGAMLTARRERPTVRHLIVAAAIFCTACTLAALAPSYGLFALVLMLVGVASQTFNTSSIGLVQMSTDAHMRGRVMAILLAIALGGQPIGAPLVGWIANTFGPRWAIGLAALAGLAAMVVGLGYLARRPEDRVRVV